METFGLILLGLAGILLHIIMKFRDKVSKVSPTDLSVKERLVIVWNDFDVLGNLIYAVFSIIVVIVCVFAKDSFESIGLPITELTIIGIGYASDSFIKNIKSEKTEE